MQKILTNPGMATAISAAIWLPLAVLIVVTWVPLIIEATYCLRGIRCD